MKRSTRNLEKAISNITEQVTSTDPEIKQEAMDKVAIWLREYGLPITGGNLYGNTKELEAINKAFNSAPDDYIYPKEMTMGGYFELLREAKYWQNLFIIQNWDELTPNNQKAIKVLLATLFMYGIGALALDENGELVPYILVGGTLSDVYGYVVKSSGYPAGMCYQYGIISFNFANKSYDLTDEAKKTLSDYKKELTPDNAVFGKWNVWGYGAWLTQIPFIHHMMVAMDRVKVASALTGLLLKQKSINGKARGAEVVLNNRGILQEIGGTGSTFSDKFEVMEVGGNGQTLNALMDYLEWYRQWFYSREGRRYNINEKQERNINSEVMYSQLNFDVLENETLRELQIMFKQVKEKFKIDIQISSPIVADDIENQEQYNKMQREESDNDNEI